MLDGVSLTVGQGVTCVIGPNGAGKSTLLKAVFGLADRTGGRILLAGEDITHLSPQAIRRRGVAYVAQGRWNFPLMTVRENLEMGAFARTDRGVAEDIQDLQRRFPVLGTRTRERAGNLSGGEQQILEMAMGLLAQPRLLLLDEPSLGLAPRMVEQVFRTIAAIAEMGVAVLMVEQNARQALAISSRAVVLDLGRTVVEGPAAAILQDARLRRAYLGGPA
ncbi:MAG: ABC transporter ATP-binding protein [Armatimonadota bacterium]|nr:ABC transporter ATP-binding protein [Armatimonadota bacterium]